jgi:hypothetical protein
MALGWGGAGYPKLEAGFDPKMASMKVELGVGVSVG